jgi:uncharacterized protein YecT (DUF1311 family)
MKIFKCTLVDLILTYGPTAYSADAGLSKKYSSCMNKSVSTQDMVECIDSEYKAQDARLNNAYKLLQKNLSADREKQLLEAQRLWIKYREANCSFYYDPNGGNMARLSANDCMMMSTAMRAKELENLARN